MISPSVSAPAAQGSRPGAAAAETPEHSAGACVTLAGAAMTASIKPASACRFDQVSLGEVMLRLDPGDVVVVPQKIIGGSLFWRNLLTVAQISSSIAITAAVAGVI